MVAASYTNYEKFKKFVLDDVPEKDKCQAHKQSDERAKAYAETIAKPIIKLKEAELAADSAFKKAGYKAVAAAYKVAAGFVINPDELSDRKAEMYKESNMAVAAPKSFGEKWSEAGKGAKPIKERANLLLKTAAKLPVKMLVDAVQFTVRNSVKQPLMVAYRAAALVNNARKYAAAKVQSALAKTAEDKKSADLKASEEARNVKYQAGKFTKAAVASVAMLAIDSAVIGSAGVAVPMAGAAGAVATHFVAATHFHVVADSAHFSSLANGAAEVAVKSLGVEGANKQVTKAAGQAVNAAEQGLNTGAKAAGQTANSVTKAAGQAISIASNSIKNGLRETLERRQEAKSSNSTAPTATPVIPSKEMNSSFISR